MLINEGLMDVIGPESKGKHNTHTTEKGKQTLESIREVYDRMEKYSLE